MTRLLLGFFTMLSFSVYATQLPNEQFIAEMVKRIRYIEAESSVWPGFYPYKTPIIIEFDDEDAAEKYAYALNFKPSELLWEKTNIENQQVYFLSDSNPLTLKGLNDGKMLQVEGQQSFVDLENAQVVYKMENYYNKLITSRAKYYFQYESKIDPHHFSALGDSYDAFNDSTQIKLIYLEDAALTLSQQDDSTKAEIALQDAIAIRQYRNQLSKKAATRYENVNDIMIGTPSYVSLASQKLHEDEFRKKSQRLGCWPLNSLFEAYMIEKCVLEQFPQYTSAVYGRALDKKWANSSWKSMLESKFKSIPNLALDHYQMSVQKANALTKAAMQKPEYQYDRISRHVDHIMSAYLLDMADLQEKFNKDNGIKFQAPIWWGLIAHLVTRESFQLNTQSILTKNIAIENMIVDEGEEEVTLKSPYLYTQFILKGIDDLDVENTWTLIKLPHDAILLIDQVRVPLAEFVSQKKVQSFQRFSIAATDIDIRAEYRNGGILDASNGELKLIVALDQKRQLSMLHASLAKVLSHSAYSPNRKVYGLIQ